MTSRILAALIALTLAPWAVAADAQTKRAKARDTISLINSRDPVSSPFLLPPTSSPPSIVSHPLCLFFVAADLEKRGRNIAAWRGDSDP